MNELLDFLRANPGQLVTLSEAIRLAEHAGMTWSLLAQHEARERGIMCVLRNEAPPELTVGYVAVESRWLGFTYGTPRQTDEDTWEYLGSFPEGLDTYVLRLSRDGVTGEAALAPAAEVSQKVHWWGLWDRQVEAAVWLGDFLRTVTQVIVGAEPPVPGPLYEEHWRRVYCHTVYDMLTTGPASVDTETG